LRERENAIPGLVPPATTPGAVGEKHWLL